MNDVNKNLSSMILEHFGKDTVQIESLKPGLIAIHASSEKNRDIIKTFLDADDEATLSAISGVDLGDSTEVLYHIRTHGTIVTLRCIVPRNKPTIASITDLIPGANFHERETADFFGVTFKGHPYPKRLLISDDWPEGVYPLRKDAEIPSPETKAEVLPEEEMTTRAEGTRTVKIVIGPQHPALLEPERFLVDVDGETVTKVTPRIGYCHRGVEKATESRTYMQDVYLVERICGICNSCHSTTFCQAVESILDVEVPSRGKFLRTIVLELNRIQSHFLVLGHAGHEIGYDALFQYMWRDREIAMDLTEILTGNRVITSFLAIGGVRRDLEEKTKPRIMEDLKKLRERAEFYKHLFEEDRTVRMRTEGVGVMDKKEALSLCVVGPVARASGLKIDVRKEAPYAAYGEVPYELISRTEGDSWARLLVRAEEVLNSVDMIEYAVNNLPAGDFKIRVPRRVAEGESISRVEAPRGELFYYVKSNGTQSPERVKIRTPTVTNLYSVIKLTEGGNIADVPAALVSLDPCFSCTDR